MDTVVSKFLSVSHDDKKVVVRVGFYTAATDMLLGDATYELGYGETIDDLKPRIKDDVIAYIQLQNTTNTIRKEINTAVDLKDVVSEKESKELKDKEK